MPCTDSIPCEPEERPTKTDLQAILCGIFTVLEARDERHIPVRNVEKPFGLKQLFASVDWKEAGVELWEVEKWWQQHKIRDEARREREKQAQKDAKDKEELLASLTPRQKKLLGLR